VAGQVAGPQALPVSGGSPSSDGSGTAALLLVLGAAAVAIGTAWFVVARKAR
jgi:hypothetical protein